MISRYGGQRALPTADQLDPLSAIVENTFPAGSTVGDAISQVLRHSGYRLPPTNARAPAFPVLFDLPLPAPLAHIGPVPLRAALGALVGEPWQPIVDPVHRYLSFELRPEYRDQFVREPSGPTDAPGSAPPQADGAPPTSQVFNAPAGVAPSTPPATTAPSGDSPAASSSPVARATPLVIHEWVMPSLSARSATRDLNDLRDALRPGQRVALLYRTDRARTLLTRSMARRHIAADRVDWIHDPTQPSFGAVARIVVPPPPPPVEFIASAGSLHDNLARLMQQHNWEPPVWQATTDRRVHGSYALDTGSAATQVSQLMTPYPLAVCIYPANRTVRVLDVGQPCN